LSGFRIDVTPSTDPVAVDLVRQMQVEMDERFGPEDDGGEGWLNETAPEHVSPPHGVFLVARLDDGTPAGCGALKRIDDQTGEVKRMFTAPAGRGKGVGRAILTRLEEEARRIGYTTMRLETDLKLFEAVALYQSVGYEEIPVYGRYAHEPENRCFEKRL
jgi:putative acetyltransferase